MVLVEQARMGVKNVGKLPTSLDRENFDDAQRCTYRESYRTLQYVPWRLCDDHRFGR